MKQRPAAVSTKANMANYSIANVASPGDLSEFVQPIHLETVRGRHTEQQLQVETEFTKQH